MILRKEVMEKAAFFFATPEWKQLLATVKKEETAHAHFNVNSILYPGVVLELVEGYFKKIGHPLKRQLRLEPLGRGTVVVFYVHPEIHMPHFEIFTHYDDEVVLVPGKLEEWSYEYIDKALAQYNFKTGEEAYAQAQKYFKSPEWKALPSYMAESRRHLHAHALVETSIDPNIIMKAGLEAINAKDWEVAKSGVLVYGLRGFDQGKIYYLLSKPEIVLEIEWEFNPEVFIVPDASNPVARKRTSIDFERETAGMNYYYLNKDDIQRVLDEIEV